MCGILGITPAYNVDIFTQALNTLTHRGPDGFGIWQDEQHITLGHRRLAILDLSEMGKQPMENERYAITFNGEIYNFIEIRQELVKKGNTFHTNTDTEVVLLAYQTWGKECLHRFNGMWALAIWDKQTKELFISRDRFGVKPLFYAFVGNKFVFASEMKAIIPFLDSVKMHKHFSDFVTHQHNYETEADCLIENIYRFPAGHCALLPQNHQGKLPLQSYWNTLDHLQDAEQDYTKQVNHFRELFFDACKLRMRSDVKIGTALSGGMDSSAVICAMAYMQKNNQEKFNKDWQNAFVATFTGTVLDEKAYAEAVVNYLGIKGIFKEINPTKGIDNLLNYLWLFEEVYATSPIPMIELYKAMRQEGVIVSIDGHGADELLSGYGNTILHATKQIPFQFKQAKMLVNTYLQTYKARGESAKSTIAHLIDMHGGRFNFLKSYFSYILGGYSKENIAEKRLGAFNMLLYEMYHKTILPTLLRNYDRYSMAASIEVRMPFLDYRLVQYSFSLPWHSKIRGGFTKAILRDAMQGFMPEEVRTRKAKIGFGTPFSDWIRTAWKDYILDHAHSQTFKTCPLINATEVQGKINTLIHAPSPTFEQGTEVWNALMPYFWYEGFYKRATNLHTNTQQK